MTRDEEMAEFSYVFFTLFFISKIVFFVVVCLFVLFVCFLW